MLFGVFSRTGPTDALRDQLDLSAQRTRSIAARVARASIAGDGRGGFSVEAPGTPGDPASTEIDVETEMAALADEHLRYEATAKLLERTYQSFRSSLRDR